jgi:hypothetical protein
MTLKGPAFTLSRGFILYRAELSSTLYITSSIAERVSQALHV